MSPFRMRTENRRHFRCRWLFSRSPVAFFFSIAFLLFRLAPRPPSRRIDADDALHALKAVGARCPFLCRSAALMRTSKSRSITVEFITSPLVISWVQKT